MSDTEENFINKIGFTVICNSCKSKEISLKATTKINDHNFTLNAVIAATHG